MSLRGIVRALGGDVYQNGRRANVPAPGHTPDDRSVSLMLSAGRVIIHSFGGATWGEVRDDLHRRGLIDRAGRPSGGGPDAIAPRLDHPGRLATARGLWSEAVPLGCGSLVLRHLASRRVRPPMWCADLAEHPRAPFSVYGPCSRAGRAMMAAIRTPGGELTAVELTYLTPGGRTDTRLRIPRKTVGRVPAGAAVRLHAATHQMLVAEGVVTTLSASAWFKLPGWALLSAGNLARWDPPPGVTHVLIAGDRGEAGEASAARLYRRLAKNGIVATIALPPAPWGDWNEAAPRLEKEKEGMGRAPAGRGWAPPPTGDIP